MIQTNYRLKLSQNIEGLDLETLDDKTDEVHYIQLEGQVIDLNQKEGHKKLFDDPKALPYLLDLVNPKAVKDLKHIIYGPPKDILSQVDEWVVTDFDYFLKGNPHNIIGR